VRPRSRTRVSLGLDGEDQVARLERFRATHPDVPVLLLGTCPKAWVGGQKIEHPTLGGLLDDLEEIVRQDARTSRPGTPR
jgi:hypothetical protein